MRRHGALGTASDLGMHHHACWIYDDDGERRKAVVDYFADGDVMLDLGGLGFVDHHGVMALAERRGLGFQNVPHPVARLSEVMGVAL